MAEKEVSKPVEPTTSSRIKVNAIYEDAKDIHVRNYILYTGAGKYLYLDETSTEKIDCDTLMDFCSKGVLIYNPKDNSYSYVSSFSKSSLGGYTIVQVPGISGLIAYYSKERVEGEIVDDPGAGDHNIKE